MAGRDSGHRMAGRDSGHRMTGRDSGLSMTATHPAGHPERSEGS